jgi:plasmid stability protein
MLLAEDLLLLVTDDGSGQLSAPAAQVDAGLAGANLVELALMNKVDLSGEGEEGRPGRIVVRDPAPVGDDVLDAALKILAANHGQKPSAVIRPLSKNLREALYERLAAAGVIRAERGKILGIFRTRTWPAQDASHEAQVRELLTQALVQQTAPDTRSAALIALLHALRCEHKVVDPEPYGLSKRQLAARAEEIAQGNWASGAVRKAIDEMNAAVIAATTAAAIATSG